MVKNKRDIKDNLLDIVKMSDILKHYGEDTYGRKICCPLHMEDTPSFYYSDDNKTFICYGCHRTGTVVEFYREYERIHNGFDYSQNQAIKNISKIFNLELEGIEDLGKPMIDEPTREKGGRYKVDAVKIKEKLIENEMKRYKGTPKELSMYKIYDLYYFGRIDIDKAVEMVKTIKGIGDKNG